MTRSATPSIRRSVAHAQRPRDRCGAHRASQARTPRTDAAGLVPRSAVTMEGSCAVMRSAPPLEALQSHSQRPWAIRSCRATRRARRGRVNIAARCRSRSGGPETPSRHARRLRRRRHRGRRPQLTRAGLVVRRDEDPPLRRRRPGDRSAPQPKIGPRPQRRSRHTAGSSSAASRWSGARRDRVAERTDATSPASRNADSSKALCKMIEVLVAQCLAHASSPARPSRPLGGRRRRCPSRTAATPSTSTRPRSRVARRDILHDHEIRSRDPTTAASIWATLRDRLHQLAGTSPRTTWMVVATGCPGSVHP